MNNVEKLTQLNMIDAVRGRLGADNDNDTSYDAQINNMDESELVGLWCGWHLGDDGWWYTLKYKYDRLKQLK